MRQITRLMTAIAVVALAAAALAGGPTTMPASSALPALSVDVWTCSKHPQFHQPVKGQCPICDADLVKQKLMLQGDDAAAGSPYPLNTCPVSGQVLGSMGPPIVMTHEGREVRFCCKGCIAKFDAEPDKYLKQIDEKIIAQQLASYPLTVCPVSEETLGEMGEPVNFVYNNRLVRFCCNGCKRGFKKDPAKYLATLDAAVVAAQTADYPLDTCVISGMKLGSMGAPVDYVSGDQLVRFCCDGCITAFYKNPAANLEKIAGQSAP